MKLHIISFPEFFEGEEQVVSQILRLPNVVFHLRKPKANATLFDDFLSAIPQALHGKIVLHDAYQLIEKYELGGLHFSTNKREIAINFKGKIPLSTSCHAMQEIEALPNHFDACFLSPIFPSISKKGYKGNFDFDAVSRFVETKQKILITALGGICESNIQQVQNMGFNGAAVLGTVWGENPMKETNMLEKVGNLHRFIERPYCLSIAGFDPSAGAGVLSDIKTFEAIGCYGFGVNTAITFQNDDAFEGLSWTPKEAIIKQLIPLKKYSIAAIKIGLIESFDVLFEIIAWCKNNFPKAKIIWDPILKASAGFTFHDNNQLPKELLASIDLITPNADEYAQLNIEQQNIINALLLKGGHRKDKPGYDTLYTQLNAIDIMGEVFANKVDKHGTGCVLSSAITAHLALGDDLKTSCQRAKKYVERFIQSNQTGLGYHA
jgi:thiamine-phosphate pyrophosphorylase